MMEESSDKNLNPFIVPPPKPTIYEEFMKNNYDLQISNLENLIKLQKDMIASKDMELANNSRQIVALTTTLEEKKDHSRCVQQINELIEKLKEVRKENDSMKNGLF